MTVGLVPISQAQFESDAEYAVAELERRITRLLRDLDRGRIAQGRYQVIVVERRHVR